ncbi:MAG: siroheme synthase [Deltaproteobacteria bacterium]|nr:MAG: siroheme synthase [Deltaproteobacteria bacterium]
MDRRWKKSRQKCSILGRLQDGPERYPILLNLRGKRCVVAGGGNVATRKVRGLVEAGAEVVVVAPRASAEIQSLVYRGNVEWRSRPFVKEDAEGALFVFAATGDHEANRAALKAAALFGALTNVADDPEGSDFHLPATLKKGGATITVSTGGASPAVAAWLRDRMVEAVPEGLELALELFSLLRSALDAEAKAHSGEGFGKLLDAGIVEDLRKGDLKAVGEKVDSVFGAGFYLGALKEKG